MLERSRLGTQLEGGGGSNEFPGIGHERAQLIDDTPKAVDRQTGDRLLATGFSAGGRRALGGIDGKGALCFCGLGIVVVEEDRGESLECLRVAGPSFAASR